MLIILASIINILILTSGKFYDERIWFLFIPVIIISIVALGISNDNRADNFFGMMLILGLIGAVFSAFFFYAPSESQTQNLTEPLITNNITQQITCINGTYCKMTITNNILNKTTTSSCGYMERIEFNCNGGIKNEE